MKNIHLLPTDQPSRLHYFTANKAGYYLYPNNGLVIPRNPNCINQNIYITSDEEIKDGDWVIYKNNFFKIENGDNELFHLSKKIILTTDQDLIADGIQAIDDEFLEWFCKNPSCEEVFIANDFEQVNQDNPILRGSTNVVHKYKIIIPKEEPKQEWDYLEGFINQFIGEEAELSNDDWTVSDFLEWLKLNKFKIVKIN